METLAARVGSRGRIVLPRAIRQKLNIRPGDTILFAVDGRTVRILPEPSDYASHTHGLGKEMWAELGGGQSFLAEERSSWIPQPTTSACARRSADTLFPQGDLRSAAEAEGVDILVLSDLTEEGQC